MTIEKTMLIPLFVLIVLILASGASLANQMHMMDHHREFERTAEQVLSECRLQSSE